MKSRTPRRLHRITAATAVVALALAVAPAQAALAAPADGTVRTFDAETVRAAPADCDIIGDVTVAEAGFGGAAATNRAMRLSDQSNTVYTRAWCKYPLTPERSVSFRFSPAQLNYGPIVAIQGAPGSSANGVWRFTLNRNGNDLSVTAYNGSVWSDVGTIPGGATLGQWQDLTINATLDRAELILNGVRFLTQVRNAASTGMTRRGGPCGGHRPGRDHREQRRVRQRALRFDGARPTVLLGQRRHADGLGCCNHRRRPQQRAVRGLALNRQ